MLANQMAIILFVGYRFVIETVLFDVEPFDEMELFQMLPGFISMVPGIFTPVEESNFRLFCGF
jgi:hypothetical protein